MIEDRFDDVFVLFEGPETESEFTDEDGTTRFRLVPGQYAYKAHRYGFGTEAGDGRGTLVVRGGLVTDFEIELPRIWGVPRRLPQASRWCWEGLEANSSSFSKSVNI